MEMTEVGARIDVLAPRIAGLDVARKDTAERSTMTPQEYHAYIEALDLSVYASAKVLGISLRSAQRYAAGQRLIPEPVAIALRAMVMLGTTEI